MSEIPEIRSFVLALESLLEVASIQPNTDLASFPEFDSMARINLSLLIEDLFSFQISYEDIDSITVVSDLYSHCVKLSHQA